MRKVRFFILLLLSLALLTWIVPDRIDRDQPVENVQYAQYDMKWKSSYIQHVENNDSTKMKIQQTTLSIPKHLPTPSILIFQPLNRSNISIKLDEKYQTMLPLEVDVCNIEGTVVAHEKMNTAFHSIDLKDNQKGIYILTILRNNKRVLVKKFLYK